MALSYYSNNWDAFQQLSTFGEMQANEQLHAELQGLAFADDSYNSIGHFFDPNNLFYSSENYIILVPHDDFPAPPPISHIDIDHTLNNCAALITDQEKLVPFQEFQPLLMSCPKRQKAGNIDHEEIYPRAIYHNSQQVVTPTGGKKSLSAQSITARHRRRRITEKTQELGKLIPGGHKMNTAEMFHAASTYIKFLQAQLGILQFMESYHHKENEESLQSEEYLHGLLGSPLIREKLYSTEKCLVPLKFVQSLSNDEKQFQSNPPILKQVKALHGRLISGLRNH